MSPTLWIAFRYFRSQDKARYAGLLTAVSVLSLAVGMFALIVVMSVMRGFRTELSDKLLGFNAHVVLTRSEGALDLDRGTIEKFFKGVDVRDIAPVVQGEVIAESHLESEMLSQGARVRGIDPTELGAMGSVDFHFTEGFDATGALSYGAVVGSEILSQLSIHPDFDDSIKLIAPLAEVLPSGELGPAVGTHKVRGAFRSGIFDYDSKYILLSLDEARRLLGLEAQDTWHIRLTVPTLAPKIAKGLRLPEGWSASSWGEQNRKLFAALKLERIAMGAVLCMVLVIASFSIVGVILLVINSKRKDMAILEAMGLTRKMVGGIFLAEASIIGAMGSALGLSLALGLCLFLKHWPIELPASYYLDRLPVDVNIAAAIGLAVLGVAIAALSSIYPVWQAMCFKPIESLRYE